MLPSNEYVEVKNDAFYIAGTRIGLDVLYYEFFDGRTAESLFDSYPSIGSLAKVYGAIAFMLSNPEEIQSYLKAQKRRFEEIKLRYPHSPGLIEAFEDAKRAAAEK